MRTVVLPSDSVNVVVLIPATSGAPSKTSVETIRSPGTISRYSPWNATSNPPFAVIA
jgi:hypothetical protein